MKLQHTHRAVLDNKSGNKIVISANQLKGLKLQWGKKIHATESRERVKKKVLKWSKQISLHILRFRFSAKGSDSHILNHFLK